MTHHKKYAENFQNERKVEKWVRVKVCGDVTPKIKIVKMNTTEWIYLGDKNRGV